MVFEITQPACVSALFEGWEETMVFSCLQGIMGRIYSTNPVYNTNPPASAMAVLGDFTFFAGRVNRELIAFCPKECTSGFRIMVGQTGEWHNAVKEHYGKKATAVSRYAFKKEPDVFDRAKLEAAVASLSPGLELDLIDEPLFHLCKSQIWSADLVSQFKNYDEYRKLGLGVVIHKDDALFSGASSYSRYREGIEIEIDTREDHRRQGLANICGARLILECLDKGLYPSWDAQNLWSVALAEKLGYHFSHAYDAVEIREY